MNAYYNEHDPFAAAWLRELIRDGLIPAGHVDERDIQLVQPSDLAGYKQCHFFAGIGGWAYALGLAGWDGPVWTGSCPCQPFSAAGKGAGFDDPRHLWPSWFRLIRECRPPVVFGEQVANSDGLAWFDTVSTDLEAEAYAVGAADLAAASVEAPHLRQRLFFVADSQRRAAERHRLGMAVPPGGTAEAAQERERVRPDVGDGGKSGVALGDTSITGLEGLCDPSQGTERREVTRRHGRATGCACGVAHAASARRSSRRLSEHANQQGSCGLQPDRSGAGRFWDGAVWLPCTDGKARPTQPGLFPLAHGIPNRVGTLRGAGNAIVPQVAAQFIRAYLEAMR